MKRMFRIAAVSLITALTVTTVALSPAEAKTTKKPKTTKPAKAKTVDIVDTAVAAGSFKTLAAALGAADLVSTLKGKGPFTVFAPTDAAFDALPPGLVAALLKPENKGVLTKILTYHVVAGSVTAKEVVKLTSAKTVNGAEVTIKVNGSKVMVNDANVTATDVMASNGVIHVIDKVLVPADIDVSSLLKATTTKKA